MLVNIVISLMGRVVGFIAYILPDYSFPSAFTDSITWFNSAVATVNSLLPSGFIANLLAASVVVVAVNVFILPWIAAKNAALALLSVRR